MHDFDYDAMQKKRFISDTVPERYFVVCETCGYRTKPHGSQSTATKEWSGK